MKPQLSQQDYDAIVDYLEECQHDPELFVKLSFPWGEPITPLENQQGPEEWQRQILREIKDNIKTAESAIREAVASGHRVDRLVELPLHRDVPAASYARLGGHTYRVEQVQQGQDGDGLPVTWLSLMRMEDAYDAY